MRGKIVMKSLRLGFVVLWSAALLQGCVAIGLSYQDIEPLLPVLSDDKGRIYIYRDTWRPPGSHTIWANGHHIGDMGGKEFLYIDLEPGKHAFQYGWGMGFNGRHTKSEESLFVQLEAGETKYLKLVIKPILAGLGSDEFYESVSNEVGYREMGECAYSGKL